MELINNGIYLINGKEIVDSKDSAALAEAGISAEDRAAAAGNTIASGILDSHNREGDDKNLKIKFDMITSHDITRDACRLRKDDPRIGQPHSIRSSRYDRYR